MRILYFAFLILQSAIGFSQSADFFVDKSLVKFPKTNEGTVLQHDYTITNTGNAPLVITDFAVACSCTKVILPPPIQPGESAKISITFDTNGKYYQQDRTILLSTNTKRKTEKLRFKVFVVPKKEK